MNQTIRLRGMSGPLQGRLWEASDLLRIGRLDALEIVLDDSSVSRYHAEVRATDRGWRVRDLGSTNGTRLNGVRLGNGQWPLRVKDLLQFGEVAVVVENIHDCETDGEPALAAESMRVAGTARSSWSEAVEGLAFDGNRAPRGSEQLVALLRAGHHLVHMEKEEDLLQSILRDAVTVLDAQRGAIVLCEGPEEKPEEKLQIRALVTGRSEPRVALAGRVADLVPGRARAGDGAGGRFQFSQSLATRCIQ